MNSHLKSACNSNNYRSVSKYIALVREITGVCFTEPAFPFRSSHTQITCSPVRAVTAALTLAGARRGYTFSRAHLACVNGLRNRSVYEDGSNSFSDPVLNGHPPSGQELTYSCSTINPLVQVSHVQWQSKVCSFCKNSGHVCAECKALQQCILNRNQPLNQLGRLGNFTLVKRRIF